MEVFGLFVVSDFLCDNMQTQQKNPCSKVDNNVYLWIHGHFPISVALKNEKNSVGYMSLHLVWSMFVLCFVKHSCHSVVYIVTYSQTTT